MVRLLRAAPETNIGGGHPQHPGERPPRIVPRRTSAFDHLALPGGR